MCKRSYNNPFYCYLEHKHEEAREAAKKDYGYIGYAVYLLEIRVNYHRLYRKFRLDFQGKMMYNEINRTVERIYKVAPNQSYLTNSPRAKNSGLFSIRIRLAQSLPGFGAQTDDHKNGFFGGESSPNFAFFSFQALRFFALQ